MHRALSPAAKLMLLTMAVASCAWSAGCDRDARDAEPLSAQDSAATAGEIAASLAGHGASQAYTYRELYAGMSRAELERHAPVDPSSAPACDRPPAPTDAEPRRCEFDTRFPRDSAAAHVEVSYVTNRGVEVAPEITVTRELPLDVDGLRLARAIASAFERQTSVLDRRDETFTRDSAQIRVGATSGTRRNVAEVTVADRRGRQRLIVHLSHPTGAAPKR